MSITGRTCVIMGNSEKGRQVVTSTRLHWKLVNEEGQDKGPSLEVTSSRDGNELREIQQVYGTSFD